MSDGASAPVTQRREFWVVIAFALALGVLGGAAGLLFMGIIGVGGDWYVVSDPGWFGGQWWWVLVTTGAGIVVGLLRHAMHVPAKPPGIIEGLTSATVEPASVPGIVAVSAVSLIGGASLGPEMALGSMGGGAGTWLSRRARIDEEDSGVNTLSGFAGAYGGLFSSTLTVVALIMEIARPGGRRATKVLAGAIVASSVSFGIYFAVVGAVFMGRYEVPPYTYEDWQLIAGVLLGLFSAVVVVALVGFMAISRRVFGRMRLPSIAKPAVGGALFGLVGVALPLTLFTGSDQLTTVLDDAGTLGLGLLVAILVAKMLTFAVSEASGFIGGPIFPALFIGGTAGIIVNQVFPALPLGLTFTCMFAAVAGSLISAPFAVVLLAAFVTQVGALQTAPILIAVITGYLAIAAAKTLMASRRPATTMTSAAPRAGAE